MPNSHAVTPVTEEPLENGTQPGEKSEGQRILERLLANTNELNQVRLRLLDVQELITGRKGAPAPVVTAYQPLPARSFFTGLASIADGNEDAARSLREAVEDLARLF